MLFALLPLLLQASSPASPARAVVDGAAMAAERGELRRWIAGWEARSRASGADRLTSLARGAAAANLYQLGEAGRHLARAAGNAGTNDDASRQARMGLARLAVTRGRNADANDQLQALQGLAATAGDTATWAEALILRSGIVRRVQSGAAAEPLLDSALALGARRWPRLAATLHCRRAGSAAIRGDLAAMRRAADEGIAAAMEAGSRRLEAACHFVRATTFARAGLTDSLRVAMDLAIGQQRATGDLAALAAARQWQGYYLIQLGRHNQAAATLAEAWTAALASGSADAQAWTAMSRAALAWSLTDARSTALWLARADTLMRATADAEGLRAAQRLRTQAAFAAGDTARGWRLLDDLQLRAQDAGDLAGVQGALAIRVRQAINAGDVGRARSAVAALRTANTGPGRTGFEASNLVFEGEVALLERRWSVAEQRFDEALRLVHPSQHFFRHGILVDRALARANAGELDEAARDARDAEDRYDAWRETIADSVLRLYASASERDLPSYRTDLIGRLAAAGRLDDALRLAESQRARRLREQLAEASAWSGSGVEAAPRRIVMPTLADLQRALPDERTALLSYVPGRAPVRTQAFVITRVGAWHLALPSVNAVGPALQRWLAGQESGRLATSAGREVARAVLDPVLPVLERAGATRLVVVAEDALQLLPFDVLPLPAGGVVLDRFEVSYMPSMAVATDLWQRDRGLAPASGILAFGDARAPRDEARRLGVEAALPGARDEVRAIARRFAGASAFTGEDATEARLKREVARRPAGVWHLAVHGVVDAWDGRQAALALGDGEGEDGLLYAGEVAGLDARGVLVVLSACRTDAGEVIAGEGVTGLTSAFLRAGARAVVTTAWRIPDRGVVPTMDAFYAGLASGAPVGSALRAARLAARRRGESPLVWGAYRVVGDASASITR